MKGIFGVSSKTEKSEVGTTGTNLSGVPENLKAPGWQKIEVPRIRILYYDRKWSMR